MVSVLVILFSMCPISAYAAPEGYYSIASDKPTVTEYSGYVELLFEHKTSGYRFVTVVGWFFTPSVNTSSEFYQTSDKPLLTLTRNTQNFVLGVTCNEYITGNMSFILIDSGNQVQFTVSDITSESTYTYSVGYGSSYNLVGIHYYGDFSDKLIYDTSNEEFYVTYGSDSVISYGLNQVISALYTLVDLMPDSDYTSQLDDIISSLNSLDTSLDSFHSDFTTVLNQLSGTVIAVLRNLETIVQNTDEVEGLLSDVFDILSSMYGSLLNIEYYVPYIYEELSGINTKLQQILNILKAEGEAEFSEPDTSGLNGYYDSENSLLNDDNVDVSGAIDVQINQQAMSTIWDLVDRFLNVNPKVIGAVITVLSLGILALILGR